MLTCHACGSSFDRPNAKGRVPDYCSTACRRLIEARRAGWDGRARACRDPGGFYALNRDAPGRTPLQAATWQAKLGDARAQLGERP